MAMMVKVKGPIGRFWLAGILSAIVVVIIGLRGTPKALQSSTIFFSAPLRVRSVFTPTNPATDRASMASSSGPKWAQKTITLPPQRRSCHLITPKILKEIGQDLSDFNCGLAHVFLQHTSASVTINENYDPDVQADTETFLNRIVLIFVVEFFRGIQLLGGIPWKVQMTCQLISNHQCLDVNSLIMADESNEMKEEVKDEQEILRRVFNILCENNLELAVKLRTVMKPPQVLLEGKNETVFVNFMAKTYEQSPKSASSYFFKKLLEPLSGRPAAQIRLNIDRRRKTQYIGSSSE